MNGLLRYNEIQRALSPIRKKEGWKLPVGGFQGIASDIYQNTKGQPLKQVLDNIDVFTTSFLPSEFQEWMPFFNFDAESKSGNGIWNPEIISDKLFVKSPQILGSEDLIQSQSFTYELHFKEFSDYCNANRDLWWMDSTNAPQFKFTQPKPITRDDEVLWITELIIDDETAYGYIPGEGPAVREEIPIIKREEPEPIEPIQRKKEEDKEIELLKIRAEAEKAKIELAKIEAAREKLTELNKAIKNLDSMLKRDLITKKQYKSYLTKLYNL
jgi:hypothetical protein